MARPKFKLVKYIIVPTGEEIMAFDPPIVKRIDGVEFLTVTDSRGRQRLMRRDSLRKA